jgi:hypothetical protein
MNFSEVFENTFLEGLSMAKKGLVEYGIIAALVLFGLGCLGYLIIKIAMPEARITSWWRSQEDAQKLAGLSWDWHMLGLAYDIALNAGGVNQALLDKAKKFFPSIIVEKGNVITTIANADHLHVAWVNKKMGVIQG